MEAVKQSSALKKTSAASQATGKNALPGWSNTHRKSLVKPSTVPSYIQPKLSINKPGDKYEREADTVAEKVMRMAQPETIAVPTVGKSPGPEDRKEVVQKSSAPGPLAISLLSLAPADNPVPALSPPVIARKGMGGSEEEKSLQKKEQNTPESTAGPSPDGSQAQQSSLETNLASTKGDGQPLAPQTNAFMSKAIGADFGGVRIHTGPKAVAMNKAVHAHAFTHGKDIYFNAGMYNPESSAGKQLLAHELTHVVQQNAAAKIQKREQENTPRDATPATVISEAATTVQRKSAKAVIAADPAFQGVVKKVKDTSKQVKKHDPAAKKVKEAQTAAKGPANEKASKAKDKKVTELDQQQPGVFNEEKFKAALKAKIAELKLNTLKEAEDFKKNNGAAAVKGNMSSQVNTEKEAAAGSINNNVKQEPNPNKEEAKVAGSPPTAENSAAAPAISGAQAAPKPASPEEVSLQKGSQGLDKQMTDAKITDKQLTKSNEPAFNKAVTDKNVAQKDAAQAPQKFRKEETGIIGQSQTAATTLGKSHLGQMTTGRNKHTSAVLAKQLEAKAKDEENRKKIADEISQKFDATKKEVEAMLAKLDTDVNKTFDDGIAEATRQFEDYVDREVRAFKINRYLVEIGGSLKWGYDLLMGPPDEINLIYKKGKDKYVQHMDGAISRVAKLVASQLNAAKKRINAGKQEIKAYVSGLPQNLQAIGSEAAKNIQSKFSELEHSVDNKQNELVDSLAEKYKAGLENIDKKIEDMKAANKGLIDQAKEAIGDVINTIIELKNMLLNVLARAADAIGLIIDDPIGFLHNLVAGVKQGIQNFVGNIAAHLKAGLMGWLFGTLAQAGIQMPTTFDAKGILSLVLQVLGLTYANVRSRAVTIVGEKVVAGLEKAAEIFIIIKNEGIGGLWKFIKEKVEELKDTVINSIKEFVITKIVVAGVTWLISLLNPASAFIKACKMIYDVIMFFVTRGKQILDLVNAVINSVTAIAKGAIGVAASAVENALAKAIPVALGFLTSLLGLDGISEKIKAIIAKIQAPINAAIDWVIHKAVALVKNVAGFFTGGKDKDKKSEYSPEKQAKIDAGIIAMHQEQNKYLKNGKISKADADKVAAAVKANHSVFSSFKVKDAGAKIKFFYTASPETEAGELAATNDEGISKLINQAIEAASEEYKNGAEENKSEKGGKDAKEKSTPIDTIIPPVLNLQKTIEGIRILYDNAVTGKDNTFIVAGQRIFVDQDPERNYYVSSYNKAEASKIKSIKVGNRTIITTEVPVGDPYDNKMTLGKINALLSIAKDNKEVKLTDDDSRQFTLAIAAVAAEPYRNPAAHITNLILLLDKSKEKAKAKDAMPMVGGGTDASKGKTEKDRELRKANVIKDQVNVIKSNSTLMSKMQELYNTSRQTNEQLVVEFKKLIINYIKTHDV